MVCAFSGVAGDIFSYGPLRGKRCLIRASSHICTQYALLSGEQIRSKCSIGLPSPWIIQREQKEYELADLIIVLSTFAYKSFISDGVPAKKIKILSLGTDTTKFLASSNTIESRLHRILSEKKLQVLMVGSFSFRKGATDLVQIAFATKEFCRFKFVGDIGGPGEMKLAKTAHEVIEFVPRQSEMELASQYIWGDVFIFPTIEDGYAVVLAQAQASGLPILTTPNCAGPDIIEHGLSGWILPVRSPSCFVSQLLWCHTHRSDLASMVRHIHQSKNLRDWRAVADDFLAIVKGYRGSKGA